MFSKAYSAEAKLTELVIAGSDAASNPRAMIWKKKTIRQFELEHGSKGNAHDPS